MLLPLVPRSVVGDDVEKKFASLLENWSDKGWKGVDSQKIEDQFGWAVKIMSEFSGLKLTYTITFIPLMYLPDEGGTSVEQIAGKLVVETTRKVKDDMGDWTAKYLPEDKPYAVAAELDGAIALDPEASYSLAQKYFRDCQTLESVSNKVTIPLVDEKIDIDCEMPEGPKDSNGDLVADGGLTEAEIDSYLETSTCVTVWKTDPDTGEKYKDEECE